MQNPPVRAAARVPSRRAVLAAGSGNLTLSTLANTDEDVKHSRYDSQGKIIPIDVTVKASDATGRFLGSSVGQTFEVSVEPTITGDITALGDGRE